MSYQSSFAASQIITDDSMVDMVEDWSACRSPSRAKRRRARGFRTRLQIVGTPSKQVLSLQGGQMLVMHPEIARQLRQHIATAKPLEKENG